MGTYEVRLPEPGPGQSYGLLPKQKEFLQSTARLRGYFGGKGAGKSVVGCMAGILESLNYPNNLGVVGRLTEGRLKGTTQKTWFEMLPPNHPAVASYTKETEVMVLKNGSEIYFRHLDDPMAVSGLNLGWFYIDEPSEIARKVFTELLLGLRRQNSSRRGWVTDNMRNPWVVNLFIKKPRRGCESFIAPSTENVHLPPETLEDMAEWLTPAQRARYIDAKVEAIEGFAFPMFDPEIHVFDPEKVSMDLAWWRFRSIDHGLAHPMCCLWWAVDETGPKRTCYIYREYYQEAHLLVPQNCAYILGVEAKDPPAVWTAIGPDVMKRDPQSGKTIWSHYHDAGVTTVLANNDRPAGLATLMHMLMPDVDGHIEVKVSSACPHLIEDLETAMFEEEEDDGKGRQSMSEDIASPGRRHALDAMRYGGVMLPPAKHKERSPEPESWEKDFERAMDNLDGEELVHPVLGSWV